MKCKRYQPWLADKALGALDARREADLAAHLAACSGCRAALDREQLLFAAIHRGVAKSVAASPSPEMAARIRRQVATEAAAAEHAWQFGSRHWIPVAVAAALLIAFGSFWLIHRRSVELVATRSAAAKPAPSFGHPAPAAGTAGGVEPKAGASPVKQAMTARVATRRVRTKVARTSPAEPEVLVEKDEAALVIQLYNAARSGRMDGASLVAVPPGLKRDADGNIVPAPLEISPLEIAKLDSGKEATQSEDNR